jgi:hypothetical protein
MPTLQRTSGREMLEAVGFGLVARVWGPMPVLAGYALIKADGTNHRPNAR